MEHSWRWFGADDPISLEEVLQTGATNVVTALHHIPNGEVWPREEIRERKQTIEQAGLKWNVVESVPVHEHIKWGGPLRDEAISNYKETLRNLAAEGVHTVVYNFMPVLDWTRTDLRTPVATGGTALSFDFTAYAAFDLYVLGRDSTNEYTKEERDRAKNFYDSLSEEDLQELEATILAGLPGSEETFSLDTFRQALSNYENVGSAQLKANLRHFLGEVVPVAEEHGVTLAVHPDDPAFPLFGLPRVVSTEEDIADLLETHPASANGLTLCTGSLASNPENRLSSIVPRFASRTHFVHLRNIMKCEDGSGFVESGHLVGDVDMVEVVGQAKREEARRAKEGAQHASIPMRPDHGPSVLADENRETRPGYSLIGRMQGLAALAGLELAIERALLDQEGD